MPTKVYSYGVHYKWARHGARSNQLPQKVFEQILLAHRVREKFVEIEHAYEDGKKAIWSSFPHILQIEEEIMEALAEKTEAKEIVDWHKSNQKTKNPIGYDATSAKERLSAANSRVKDLRQKRRDEIGVVYKSHPWVQDSLSENYQKMFQGYTDTRLHFCKELGLYHSTYYEVKNSHDTAVKNIGKKRARGEYARLKHHRFDATGVLAVYLKKERPGKPNQRTLDKIADTEGPHKNVFTLPFIDADLWEDLTRSQQRKQGRIVARMRIKDTVSAPGEEGIVEIPIQMHRPLPKDGVIKSVTLIVKKRGSRHVVTLNIRVEVPEPDPVEEDTSIAVHFGWRKDPGERVRAMTWLADSPLKDWEKIKNNPRYPALNEAVEISDDLCSGKVSVPAKWMAPIVESDEILSARDTDLDDLRKNLVEWFKDVGPLPHPPRYDHAAGQYVDIIDRTTGQPLIIDAARVKAWKSPKRFIALVEGWKDFPPSAKDADQIIDMLETWRTNDKKMLNQQDGLQKRARLRRDDLYAQVASLLTENYGTVITDTFNHADLAELPNQDVELPDEVAKSLGRQRSRTAAATLRSKILSYAAREGVPTEEFKALPVSIQCMDCHTVNIRVKGQMKITCSGCQRKYDVDSNAVRMLTFEAV